MTDETSQSAGDSPEEGRRIQPAATPPETAREASGAAAGPWRWAIGAVVVLLLVYPLARWMIGAGGATAATPAVATQQLQSSFEHFQAGRYPEAIVAAKAAIAADPKLAEAYNNLAVSYMALHQVDDASRAAQEAVKLKPDYQLAKNNLSWILREMAAGAAPPAPADPAAVTLLNQSLAHFQAGRFKECMDTAAQTAKLTPTSAQAFNNIGICAANLQLWDEAIRNTEEAIRLAPNFQLAKNNLAWIQRQKAAAGR